ncbi:hypothetical protein [Streptomyces sp. NPDC088766]
MAPEPRNSRREYGDRGDRLRPQAPNSLPPPAVVNGRAAATLR